MTIAKAIGLLKKMYTYEVTNLSRNRYKLETKDEDIARVYNDCTKQEVIEIVESMEENSHPDNHLGYGIDNWGPEEKTKETKKEKKNEKRNDKKSTIEIV